ncbi:MAG: TonB family protein [Desulfobacterales bacterium]|nr:TonB family protein [Desulfobacterales bacterium]
MKRILLSAIIAMGIHAYLLWADFGWMGKKPYLKPKPQMVTLALVSRPMPKAEPAPKLSKPAAKSTPEPAPEPKPKPTPKSEPESGRDRVSDIKAIPPPPEKQMPSQLISESQPVHYSKPDPITGEEKPDVPASPPGPEPRLRTILKTDEQKKAGSDGTVEQTPAPPLIREAKPRYRDNPPPHYPILARKRNYQGTVILEVFIDKNGRVADMKIFSSSGYTTLDKAARTTVEDWLFEPGMEGENKIEMWVKIPIRFQLK